MDRQTPSPTPLVDPSSGRRPTNVPETFHVKPFVKEPRPVAGFTIRETDGLFEVLFDGAPLDLGVAIECPYEAEAFLRAVEHGAQRPGSSPDPEHYREALRT